MPDKIFVQPDGKLAVFSTVTGTFLICDATDQDVMERAARMAGTSDTRNGPTWEQALESNRIHGGDLLRGSCPSCEHGWDIHSDDGCWFTVSAGRPEKNAVCQCRIRPDGIDPLKRSSDHE